MMTLYGTTVSPFVRQVRVHLLEMGLPFQFTDTAVEVGQTALRDLSPLWKVPVLVVDGQALFEVRVILSALWERHREAGLRAGLRAPGTGMSRVEEDNLTAVIDGALDAAINRFHLLADGAADAGYVAWQAQRVQASLRWVAKRLRGPSFTGGEAPGVPEISLVCMLEWLQFRRQFDVESLPVLASFLAGHGSRPSIRETRPGG